MMNESKLILSEKQEKAIKIHALTKANCTTTIK